MSCVVKGQTFSVETYLVEHTGTRGMVPQATRGSRTLALTSATWTAPTSAAWTASSDAWITYAGLCGVEAENNAWIGPGA